jgi:hypothetical protein
MMIRFIPIILSAVCLSADAQDLGLVVEKNTNREGYSFLADLPKNVCKTVDGVLDCKFGTGQKIRWGAGYCQNTRSAIEELKSKSKIELIINDKIISSELISENYETYDRDNYAYCHTWLVEISNFQVGKYVLRAVNNGRTIEVANIEVY